MNDADPTVLLYDDVPEASTTIAPRSQFATLRDGRLESNDGTMYLIMNSPSHNELLSLPADESVPQGSVDTRYHHLHPNDPPQAALRWYAALPIRHWPLYIRVEQGSMILQLSELNEGVQYAHPYPQDVEASRHLQENRPYRRRSDWATSQAVGCSSTSSLARGCTNH